MTKIGFLLRIRDNFWVKITLVNSRVFKKPKIAHNFLNNGRKAVLTPFLDIDIFELFGNKIDFYRQIDKKKDKNRPKNDQNRISSEDSRSFLCRNIFFGSKLD